MSRINLQLQAHPSNSRDETLVICPYPRRRPIKAGSPDEETFHRHPENWVLQCEYSEYLSGIAGAGRAERQGRIPAFEEMSRFLPNLAVVTKAADGLIEV